MCCEPALTTGQTTISSDLMTHNWGGVQDALTLPVSPPVSRSWPCGDNLRLDADHFDPYFEPYFDPYFEPVFSVTIGYPLEFLRHISRHVEHCRPTIRCRP